MADYPPRNESASSTYASPHRSGRSIDYLLLPSTQVSLLRPRSHGSRSPQLEEVSIQIAEALNDHSTKNPAYDHLDANHNAHFPSPSCTAENSGPFTLRTKKEFIERRHECAANFPSITAKAIDVLSQVDERRGIAAVWLSCRLGHYGQPDMMRRESVICFDWKRNTEREWKCISSNFLHGYFE